MGKLVVILIVGLALYFAFRNPTPSSSSSAPMTDSVTSTSSTESEDDSASTTSGGWGEGHQAGYDWAEEEGIDNKDDCEVAGDNSNSPSFAEGCSASVEENQ